MVTDRCRKCAAAVEWVTNHFNPTDGWWRHVIPPDLTRLKQAILDNHEAEPRTPQDKMIEMQNAFKALMT